MKKTLLLLCFIYLFTSCKKEYACQIGSVNNPEPNFTKEKFRNDEDMKQWCKDNSINGNTALCFILK